MREVKAVKINAADFAPYGTFCSMTEPEGYPLEYAANPEMLKRKM